MKLANYKSDIKYAIKAITKPLYPEGILSVLDGVILYIPLAMLALTSIAWVGFISLFGPPVFENKSTVLSWEYEIHGGGAISWSAAFDGGRISKPDTDITVSENVLGFEGLDDEFCDDGEISWAEMVTRAIEIL